MHSHSSACEHRPCPGRGRVPYRGRPKRRVVAPSRPYCGLVPGRVAGPGGRVVAPLRASACAPSAYASSAQRPCSQPLPLSRYNCLYRDTPHPFKPASTCHDTKFVSWHTFPAYQTSACHDTTECIVTRSASSPTHALVTMHLCIAIQNLALQALQAHLQSRYNICIVT